MKLIKINDPYLYGVFVRRGKCWCGPVLGELMDVGCIRSELEGYESDGEIKGPFNKLTKKYFSFLEKKYAKHHKKRVKLLKLSYESPFKK